MSAMAMVAATERLSNTKRSGAVPSMEASAAGTGSSPRTESSTILMGHGCARLAAVSVTMVNNTTAAHRQYGLTRPAENLSTCADCSPAHRDAPATPGNMAWRPG